MTQEELSRKVDGFVGKYTNKQKGYPTDSSYKGECLSIVKLYMEEVFGFKAPPSGSNSAHGYWSNFPSPLGNYFERIPYGSSEKPFKGCVPIWNTNVGFGYGHIDIYLEGDNNGFSGFDQNWAGRHAHIQWHNFLEVVGWLKPKLEQEQLPEITDKTKIPVGKVNEFDYGSPELQALRSMLYAKDKRIMELESQESQPEPPFEPFEPEFKRSIARFFYELAKTIG